MKKEKLISILQSFKEDKTTIDDIYEYIMSNSCDCNNSCCDSYCYDCDCDNENCSYNK